MNDINHNKTTPENQENITKKSESSTSEDLSKNLLTPDQKMDKLMEGMNNMMNGVTQTIELFKQMMKVQIESSTTTNKMITEEKEMMIKLMEWQIKQDKHNEEQKKIINEFITKETERWKRRDIIDELQKYANVNEDIKELLKEVNITGNINRTNKNGNTLLHLALYAGQTNMAKTLLHHPDIMTDRYNNFSDTPSKIAHIRWYVEIEKLLK